MFSATRYFSRLRCNGRPRAGDHWSWSFFCRKSGIVCYGATWAKPKLNQLRCHHFHPPSPILSQTQRLNITVIGMMYSLFFVFYVFSIVSFSTDDLNSDTILFDDTQSSLFLPEDNEFSIITDAGLPNPCVAVEDDQEEKLNLFSRDDHPQCLPPVEIGPDALQLFESPLNSLENILLPFQGETSTDSNETPGLFLNGEQGDWDPRKQTQEDSWQPYTGGVRVEPTDDNTCRKLTADRGDYNAEVCCN